MPLHLIRNDITTMKVDAIVNAANAQLRSGGGVCGAIFEAAGHDLLHRACREIGGCATGQAVITPGFDLPARYVIHAVGPIWTGGQCHEEELLVSCYRSALTLAVQHELQSIAFPLISGGVYGYPKDQAVQVAVRTIRDFLNEEAHDDLDVYLVLYGGEAFTAGSKLYGGIRSYISDSEVKPDLRRMWMADRSAAYRKAADLHLAATEDALCAPSAPSPCTSVAFDDEDDTFDGESELKSWMRSSRETTFAEHLLALIDATGEKDVVIYKRANLDRRLFSKIRSNMAYQPSKSTVMALCMALHLDRNDANLLLEKAGYALTHTNQRDLAVIWCIEHQHWDVFDLNMVLFDMNLPGLGA